MRLAHDYLDRPRGEGVATGLPASGDEFHEHLGYEGVRFGAREELLAYAEQPWAVELRAVLRELLDPRRAVLSVGSGKGEHEVPLFLEGYDITASDLSGAALDDARRLFPGFKAIELDVLAPAATARYDDLLATGIDYALDDAQLMRFLDGARSLLRAGGRVILVLRYHDNLATRLVDSVLLPAWAAFRRARYRRRGEPLTVVKRTHGYRRTRAELVRLAEHCGWRVGRVRYAGFGLELERVPFPRRALSLVRRFDRRLHVFNSLTVFELLPQ